MRGNLLKLVPDRVKFDQFWIEIRKRNKWLIMLRYGAVAMLLSLIAGIYVFRQWYPAFHLDTLPLWIIAAAILLYNMAFHRLWHVMPVSDYLKERFHGLHFALLQICADFIALMLFIYYTGGVESPIYAFFIFHVIIGSLILPGAVVNLLITGMLVVTVSGAILESWQVVPHMGVQGVLPAPLYDNTAYLFIFFIFFGITLYLSVYLANSIAKQLYRRERDLTIAYQELENAEKAKSRYVMSVVHDLKTPIAAATTYLNMILDGNLGEVPADQLRPLERSRLRLNHAITTINDILHISQLKLETEIDRTEDIDLTQLFDEIYSEMRVLFRSKNIQYSFSGNTEDKLIIKAEPKLMKLALSNLVSNAYKYTEDGGRVEVRTERVKNGINIRIADNGIGIPESEKEKIFNDFYRSSVSKAKGIEGTGLGISIVMQIIQRYGGTIEVESPSCLGSSGRPGTEFVLFLPER